MAEAGFLYFLSELCHITERNVLSASLNKTFLKNSNEICQWFSALVDVMNTSASLNKTFPKKSNEVCQWFSALVDVMNNRKSLTKNGVSSKMVAVGRENPYKHL